MFYIYLSVVVVLQYAQILKKTTTLFESIRDETVQSVVRLLVVTLASAISALRYSLLCQPKNISYISQQDSVVPTCFGDHYLNMGLLLTSLLVNAVLRILILRRSRKQHKPEERRADLWRLFCMALFVVALFKSFLWLFMSLESSEVKTKLLGTSIVSRTKRALIGLFICWIIPTFIVTLHGPMRKYMLKKVMKAVTGVAASLVYVVRYVYASVNGIDVTKASSTVHPKD